MVLVRAGSSLDAAPVVVRLPRRRLMLPLLLLELELAVPHAAAPRPVHPGAAAPRFRGAAAPAPAPRRAPPVATTPTEGALARTHDVILTQSYFSCRLCPVLGSAPKSTRSHQRVKSVALRLPATTR